MEQFILNLLKDNKRVIIPDFGAFIIRPFNPPEIAFNSLLTFNDGILTEYVSRKSGISYVEAAAKVSDYAEKLKTDLRQHNRLSFNEIGWIWTDDSGEMQFTSWDTNGKNKEKPLTALNDLENILKETKPNTKTDTTPFILDESLKEVDVDATKDDHTQTNPEMVTGKITEESFTLEDTVNKTETVQSDQSFIQSDNKTVRKIDFEKAIAPEPIIQKIVQKEDQDTLLEERIKASLSAIKAKSEGTDGSKQKSTKHELSPDDDWRRSEIKPAYSSKIEKEKKKRPWLLPLIIAGLIIILAGTSWLMFPDHVKKFLSNINPQPDKTLTDDGTMGTNDITSSENEVIEQVTEQGKTSESEQLNATSETVSQSEKTSATTENVTPADSDDEKTSIGKYYIVAGSFRSGSNAEQYAADLRQKGFNSEVFITHDNLYRVSFNSYSSRAQAEEELKHIRQTTEPQAWILFR
jgi:cell division septation protein DedD/nucleoid DNA-binding protein